MGRGAGATHKHSDDSSEETIFEYLLGANILLATIILRTTSSGRITAKIKISDSGQ